MEMEEIYVNVETIKPVKSRHSTNQKGPRITGRRTHGAVVLFLVLLSVFLLSALICLGVHHYGFAQHWAALKANLTECVHAVENKTSSLSELRRLSKQMRTCANGWTMVSSSCYLLSVKSDVWENGRKDCRNRGADLVVINSAEEQKFLNDITEQDYWIGLSDRDSERTWKWTDGTPLTLAFWRPGQPDNGNGELQWGEEDCAVLCANSWNDLRCDAAMKWICEKTALAFSEI